MENSENAISNNDNQSDNDTILVRNVTRNLSNFNNNIRKGKYSRQVFNDFCYVMDGTDVGFMNFFLYILFGPYFIYRLMRDKTIPCIISCFVFMLIIYVSSMN